MMATTTWHMDTEKQYISLKKKTSLSTDKHSALTFPGNQQILNGGVRGTRALHTQLE